MNILKNIPSPIIAISGLLLICLIFFHQPLFSGGIVNATDILTQQYFWNVFTKESLLNDPSFRTWLPYINAGTPFSGGLDLLFRPVTFLTLLFLPVHIAINYEMVMYFFLLGIFMYFYMRELEVSSLSAFLAALILMLNGEIVSLMNAGHVNKIGAIFPVPLIFWMFERALRRKTLTAFVIAGVALGFQFWQGHVQISFYTCIAVFVYYLIRLGVLYRQEHHIKRIIKKWSRIFRYERKTTKAFRLFVIWGRLHFRHAKAFSRRYVQLFLYAGLMIVVFLLLSAVSFLPLLSFAQVSERAKGVDYEFATSWSLPPEELVTYLIPGFFGLRRANYDEDEENVKAVPYWGRAPFMQTGRYCGLLPLLFMFLALCFVRNKHILTLTVIALVVLLLGMGRYIPTYKLLYEYVPGFNMFRVPLMILFLFAFATSGLAGFGAEWFLSNFSETKDKRLRIFLIVCIGIFLLSWLITILLPQFKPTLFSLFNETLFRKGATPEIADARFQNIFRGFLQFNAFLGIALFVLGLRLVKHIRIWGLVSAIILMYLVDIWLFNEKYIDTIAIEDSIYVNENDAIRYCKADPEVYYRILPMISAPATYNVSNKYLYYKLFNVSGYEAVGVQYYNDYLQNMALGTALVDLLNIKYIILPKNIEFEDGQPVQVGKTIGPYKVVMDTDAILLENLNYLPRAFPVHNAYVIKTRDEIFSTLLNPTFNPRKAVILEEVPNVSMSPENVPFSQSKAKITYYLNRTIQLNVSMATEGFLVLSEKYYRGWKAYVNGRQTKIYKANYTLQAIYLPKGQHEVMFSYQPQQFVLGFIITAITGLCLLGIFIYKKKSQGRMRLMIQEQIERFIQKTRPVYYSRKFLYGIMGIGIILHTVQYLFNRSLHIDEASLALNLVTRSFSGLLQPLDSHQGAPIGFLMIEKLLVYLFGESEYVLRLFPFFSGILAIVLFYQVASHYLKPFAVPIALGFFALSEQLIIFSSTVKQYSSDVLFALLIYTAVIRLQSKGFTPSEVTLLGAIGAFAVCCSHPAAFVLAGVGISLMLLYALKKDWGRVICLVIAGIIWLLSFLILYVISYRYLQQDEYLRNFWAGSYINFPPLSIPDAFNLLGFFAEFMGYTIGLSQTIFNALQTHSIFRLLSFISDLTASVEDLPLGKIIGWAVFGGTWAALYFMAASIMFIGWIALFLKNKGKFLLLTLPIFFTLLAGGLQKFPIVQRLLLFLIPTTILFLGEGFALIKEKTKQSLPLLGVALPGLLLIYPVLFASYHIISPRTDQELRPVLQHVQKHWQEGDTLYVYYGARGPFTYYAKRFDFYQDDYILGISSRNNWKNYLPDLDQLRGKKRVWLIFSHVFGYEEIMFLQYLDSIGGKRLDSLKRPKASGYLYDLSSTTSGS